eukprot:CAMPEP_0117651820 /NCGR_PEP_ID=MMETSP0804-20121206/2296_1 /TAXON_ID=1074897 /ORGANISM="Tetraselmis astigmatica, Strain CCMP880" /LENGTH=614 /DNA_ID=CAMNT_0005457823 /DNA_START=150 /DNA_END=1991 /DNA_ORIENTATION=-
MDLLALATADGQVAVQRLIWEPVSWQQLWSSALEVPVTTHCWRPDGKALAVGQSDGGVALFNVENGELIHRQASHRAAVRSLCWVEGRNTAAVDDRVPAFFNPPAGFQTTISQAAATTIYTGVSRGDSLRRRWPPQPKQMSVLVSVDAEGNVHILAHGTFLLISFKLADVLPQEAGILGRQQGQAVALSRDLRQLAVLCSDGESGSGGSELRLAMLDTSILADRSAELQKLALQASQIGSMLEVARDSLKEGEAQWAAAMKQARGKWEQLRGLLADHASMSTPKKEILTLLACGVPSAAMRQFLSPPMGETGTKRLAKAVDFAVMAVHELLLNNVVPALEIVIFRLGELHGLACCSDWIRPIHLKEGALKSAEQFAMRLLVRAKQVMLEVTTAGALYRSFFLWMLHSVLLLNFDNMPHNLSMLSNSSEEVLQFLETQFEVDAIGPELACKEGSPAYSPAAGGGCGHGGMLLVADGVQELQRIFFGELPAGAATVHLGAGLRELTRLCQATFRSLPPLMAKSVRTLSLLPLAHIPPDALGKHAIVSCIKHGDEGRESDVDVMVAAGSQGGSLGHVICCLATARVTAARSSGGGASALSGWAALGVGLDGRRGSPE